ncbi:hypothetical protein Cme02nite_38520 [Catellatospora methionotrophica]|uniref:Uncharacterized protein n=1 Tax=Catellatospora methionotrophica TaxID=121620 RepID=A0A8J3LJA6_9ACTN|nr:hypothetical protein [Catellatospora methionotrophica]GIG15520.1 hypothetical protein Cme02nite_38520 [Catellatospora methionotrophica]
MRTTASRSPRAETGQVHNAARYKNSRNPCRCYKCSFSLAQYRIRVVRLKRKGCWQPFVDAEPVRQHVRRLMAAGVGRRRVAELAQVDGACITRLLYGQRGRLTRQVRPGTAERILAIPVAESSKAPTRDVDALGVRRRIEALSAIGWSLAQQATEIGWDVRNLWAMMRRTVVRAQTAVAVEEMYDRLSMTPAPVGRGRTSALATAHRNGWFPPLAWDDIDDPAAVPCLMPAVDGSDPAADELQIQHWAAGHDHTLTRVEEVEIVRRLLVDETPFAEIARRLGRSQVWVTAVRREIEGGAGRVNGQELTA